MSNFTYIYNIQGDVKLLDTLNYTLEEFKANPQGCYPKWNIETMYATDTLYEFPILSEGTIREMTKYEKYKKGLYELLENEVEYKNDIIVLEPGQYLENGEIKSKEKIEGLRVEWNWKTHIWEEKATDLEIIQAQYNEYAGMDTPSTLKEMQDQDPALATELINMLIELRGMMYSLQSPVVGVAFYKARLSLPQPSQKLKDFKNKFNKI